MRLFNYLPHNFTSNITNNAKWALTKTAVIVYYGAGLVVQTLGDSTIFQELADYTQNRSSDEDDLQFNTLTKLGLGLSLVAAIPFTLTVISVARKKHSHSNSHDETELMLMSDHSSDNEEQAEPEHHKQHNIVVKAITIFTRPMPFLALGYGSMNRVAQAILKNKKLGPEIAAQIFCTSFSSINAKNLYELHTHHANAPESYFDLLAKLSLGKKIKGIAYTIALACGHAFEGGFEIKVGLKAAISTAIFFGLPEYRWLNAVSLLTTLYFSGSMLIDATRTESRAILLKMLNQETHHHNNHPLTSVWLGLLRIPHGLMPALGSIEFANLLYCIGASNFGNLTSECPNNLTDQLDFVPRMMVLGLACVLFGYSASEGASATCQEATDQFVRQMVRSIQKLSAGPKQKMSKCYATLFASKKHHYDDASAKDFELATLLVSDNSADYRI